MQAIATIRYIPGRAAERLLYILGRCPEQFFSAAQEFQLKDWLVRWQRELQDNATLQPKERAALITAARVAALGNKTQGQAVAGMLHRLSRAIPARNYSSCGPTFRHLLIGLTDDWMARSGALWFDYSDSMLFMLMSCPEDFYFTLDQRLEVLASWLGELPNASFWGGDEGIAQREALQRSLVQFMQAEQPPEYLRSTHDDILNQLKTLCVTGVDVTTPCEMQQSHKQR
jgi:hypothetical protein